MVAPSRNFTPILDSQVDGDSPVIMTLMAQIADNLTHLEEWLGDGFVAAKDHDHDGVNSKGVVGASLVKIGAPVVASNDSEVVFSVDDTYDHYILEWIGVRPATDDTEFKCQYSNDNGVSFENALYQNAATSTSSINLAGATSVGDGLSNVAGRLSYGVMNLWEPARNDFTYCNMTGLWHPANSSTTPKPLAGVAVRVSTEIVTDFRVYMLSGNIAEGTFQLFGVKK